MMITLMKKWVRWRVEQGRLLTDKKRERLSMGALFVVTLLWGAGFVAVKGALDSLPPSGVLLARFGIGALLTGAVFHRRIARNYKKGDLKRGAAIGTLLFVAFIVQTQGLAGTTPGVSAFLTATYVVFVPFIWWAVHKKRPAPIIYLACGLSLLGAGVLSLNLAEGISIGRGDAITLASAVLFAAHIVATGVLAKSMDTTVLTVIQLGVAGVWSFFAFLLTGADFSAFLDGKTFLMLAYLGVFSTFVCYYLQTTAQRYVSSAKAGVIMACEALFGALFSVLFGFDTMSLRMAVGGLLMFLAVLLPEVWAARREAKNRGGASADDEEKTEERVI